MTNERQAAFKDNLPDVRLWSSRQTGIYAADCEAISPPMLTAPANHD